MQTIIASDRTAMGKFVADHAAADLRDAIARTGSARIIVATGSSQFEVLEQLITQPDVDWSRVTGFHLDEYVGLSIDHPASFCGYLQQRFVSRVPLGQFHYLRGDEDPQRIIAEAGELLRRCTVDVALIGIGENGHLAFNDPPADFETDDPYLVVELDEACRRQQVGEGWFKTIDAVPTRAISMSIRQILKSKAIYCSVPDARKSEAVRATLEGPVSPAVPASILRDQPHVRLVLDEAAASELSPEVRSCAERLG